MKKLNISQVKLNFSKLVSQAGGGEHFIIAKRGKALVKVVSIDSSDLYRKRRIGFLEGVFSIPDDFDQMNKKAIEKSFTPEK